MVPSRSLFDVDLDKDVRAVEQMAAQLTPYIYEDELFGVMPNDLPRLTVGGLLMRLHRLEALRDLLMARQQETVDDALQRLNQVRKEWPLAVSSKVTQELKSRLNALGQAISECEENKRTCRENYPSDMEKRVIIELLKDELQAHDKWTDEVKGALSNLDNRIRRVAEKDDFCWDKRVEPAYPREKFWFLYMLPPRPKRS
jgi:hypothetical protein